MVPGFSVKYQTQLSREKGHVTETVTFSWNVCMGTTKLLLLLQVYFLHIWLKVYGHLL